MATISTALPATVKAGGIDIAVIALIPEEEETVFISNTDVFPEPHAVPVLSLILADDKRATLRGFITGQVAITLPNDKGIDFGQTFVAKQSAKIVKDEVDFAGHWKGTLQFSKFRWVLKDLTEATADEFAAGEKAFKERAALITSYKSDEKKAEALFKDGKALGDAGKFEAAISTLSEALAVISLQEEDNEDEEAEPSTLRLQVLAARSEYSFKLNAFYTAIRDCILIEKIYGSPIEAIQTLKPEEGADYFGSMLRKAQANERLGNTEDAASNYLAMMILKALSENQAEDAETEDKPPVNATIAENLVSQASEAIKKMDTDPSTVSIYTLKISLKGVEPPVWRTIEATADSTLGDLHDYIVTVMGWVGGATHEFEVYDHGPVKFTSIPEIYDEEDEEENELDYEQYEDEQYATIGEVTATVGEKFKFFYETSWEHDVEVVAIRQEIIKDDEDEEDKSAADAKEGDAVDDAAEDLPEYPKCIDGARACPPEELGPEGYASFVKAVKGEATEKFKTRLEALEFAVERIGFTNYGLDSWGGIKGKVHVLGKDGKEVKKLDKDAKEVEEEKGNPEEGGWDPEAFNVEDVNNALKQMVSFLDGDDWESDSDDEEINAKEE